MERRLIMMHGLPCSGKTTIAKKLCERRKSLLYFSTDNLRLELDQTNVFDRKERLFVYDTLIQRVEESLMKKKNIIVDATFSTRLYRKKLFDICRKWNISPIIFWCFCSESCLEERMKYRLISTSLDSRLKINTHELVKGEIEPLEIKELTGISNPRIFRVDTENYSIDIVN